MQPKVSIVVPSYNDAEKLPHLLQSIKRQTYTHYEILLIDGGSTDHTADVVKQNKALISYFISEPDKGIFDAMNKGIEAATGEWIYFVGCDDEFYNNDTLKIIFENEDHSEADILYGKIFNKKKQLTEGEKINSVDELMTVSLWHQAMFYRSSVFKETGKFDPSYKITADVVYNLSTYTQFNFKWKFINVTVSVFSGEGISSEVVDKKYHEKQYELYFKWFADLEKKVIYNGLQYHMYNQIKFGNISKALRELLLIVKHTGKINPYLKNAGYYIKTKYFRN